VLQQQNFGGGEATTTHVCKPNTPVNSLLIAEVVYHPHGRPSTQQSDAKGGKKEKEKQARLRWAVSQRRMKEERERGRAKAVLIDGGY